MTSFSLCRFFPGIFLYCVVGALINKGSGKTGKDMIPNAKFWSNLPGLISVSVLVSEKLPSFLKVVPRKNLQVNEIKLF